MNVWLWCATTLLALLAPLGVYAFVARSKLDALVAVEAAAAIFTLVLVLLAEGFRRSAYTSLAVVAAVITFAGSLVFVRFFERELDA